MEIHDHFKDSHVKSLAQYTLRSNSELEAIRAGLSGYLDYISVKSTPPIFPELNLSRRELQLYAGSIKFEFWKQVFRAIRTEISVPPITNTNEAIGAILGIGLQRYGVIYPLSRPESIGLRNYLNSSSDGREAFYYAMNFTKPDVYQRIVNQAVFGFMKEKFEDGLLCLNHYRMSKNSILAENAGKIAINEEDLELLINNEASNDGVIFDLHDLAHATASQISGGIFSSKYSALDYHQLPHHYRSLIQDARIRTEHARPFSDGLIFSEGTLFRYNEFPDRSESDIVNALASEVTSYLQGVGNLHHITTGLVFRASQPCSPVELGVLAQKKLYEYPASELEEELFIRGDGGTLDPLASMTIQDRFNFIYNSKGLNYLERRNILRHRSHTLGILRYAYNLKNSHQDTHFQEITEQIIQRLETPSEAKNKPSLYANALVLLKNEQVGIQYSTTFHHLNNLTAQEVPEISVFLDLGMEESKISSIGRKLLQKFQILSSPLSTREEVYSHIKSIARTVLEEEKRRNPSIVDNALLVPLMRAGLPVWDAGKEILGHPQSSFPDVTKEKGTNTVTVMWNKTPQFEGRHLFLLDSVIATGDSVLEVVKHIQEVDQNISGITIVGFYVSPAAIEKLMTCKYIDRILIGIMAINVDDRGYLQPPTNGDIGDRMFGI